MDKGIMITAAQCIAVQQQVQAECMVVADYCGADLMREGGTAVLAPFFRSRIAVGVEEARAAQGISRPSLQQGETCAQAS